MNSKQIKNNQSGLTSEDIHLYQTTSDERLKHTIEKKSLENDFDADALEGWNDSSLSIAKMKKFDTVEGGARFGQSFRIYAISIIGIVSTHLFFMYFTFLPRQYKEITSKNDIVVDKIDFTVPNEIAKLVELPSNYQIKSTTITKDFKQSKSFQANNLIEQDCSSQANHEAIVLDPKNDVVPEDAQVKTLSTKIAGKEIYLSDLKLLDYRAYRSKPTILSQQAILTGSPASESGFDTKSESSFEWKNVEIPYVDYLEKTMILFAKGNNKKALTRFEEILKTYPDDVNALFYAGLCYYNLGEFDKAIQAFTLCGASKYMNFSEEAEWYMAKSFSAAKNIIEAKKLFEKIAGQNGYYAKNAKTILTNQFK
ncbi:MAG: tetratricopeptide repeat protein [Bacteroidota bacterium]